MTRREAARLLAGAAGAPVLAGTQADSVWTPAWDRGVIETAVAAQDEHFDPRESMIGHKVGGAYNYHSALREQVVHGTRDSLDYALMLLEAGGAARVERAVKIVDRVIGLQETDPAGKFYGIWGYYLEEPAPKMSPADFNWADFNGSLLLLIELRHGAKLPPDVRKRVRESIRHAAYSVKRRNVTMTYTNIAVQGTFVTLAAAQLLDDKELWAYATDRQRRFAKTVDETGSFAEYNSPTYANVTIVNLTRIRMFVKDVEVLALNEKLHKRIWLHLGSHWHVPTRQLAGPMSRSYTTDIGSPLWLQKALGGRIAFATLEEVRSRKAGAGGETGVVDYRCPEKIAPMFLEKRPARQHRELFTPTVQGTTWLDDTYALGSANRGNFWIQQRALLAYWGGPERPAHYAQLRLMHDDYDFSSALLYTTQERGRVLGLVNFRNPGGDKHVSIDMIRTGEFTASSLRLRLDIADPGAKAEVHDGRLAVIQATGVTIAFEVLDGEFAGAAPIMRIGREEGRLAVLVDLLKADQPKTVRWADVGTAFLAFLFEINGSGGRSLEGRRHEDKVFLRWNELELTGSTRVRTIQELDAAFAESRAGKPVPTARLGA
jgi:hypothetical protein